MFKVSIKSGKRETNTVEATYWEICICFQVIRSLDTFVHYYLKYNWDHEYHSSLKYHRSRGEVTSSRGSPPKGPTPHNEKGQMYPPPPLLSLAPKYMILQIFICIMNSHQNMSKTPIVLKNHSQLFSWIEIILWLSCTLATSGNFSISCFIMQNPSSSLTSTDSFQLINWNKQARNDIVNDRFVGVNDE